MGGVFLKYMWQAYQYAFCECGRHPLFWGTIAILYFICSWPVTDKSVSFVLALLSMVMEVGVMNAALQTALSQSRRWKSLMPDVDMTARCFAVMLFFLPFYWCIAYIVVRITGFDLILADVITENIFSIVFYRFSFDFLFVLAANAGMWRSLQLSWSAILPAFLPAFIFMAVMDGLLGLPGVSLDLYWGLEHGFWRNLFTPVISSLALAHFFVRIVGVPAAQKRE